MFRLAGEMLHLVYATYQQGGTALTVQDADGLPYATLSVWLPESKALPEGTFYLKDYAENAAVAAAAIASGEIEAANPFLYPPVQAGFKVVKAYQHVHGYALCCHNGTDCTHETDHAACATCHSEL